MHDSVYLRIVLYGLLEHVLQENLQMFRPNRNWPYSPTSSWNAEVRFCARRLLQQLHHRVTQTVTSTVYHNECQSEVRLKTFLVRHPNETNQIFFLPAISPEP